MRRERRVQEGAVERWVRQLNRLGRELDEQAAAIHPSAWHEQLADLRDRWLRLAARGPRGVRAH